ncbi:MAG TPA: alginate lyase family protein [Xanthobacteraceae bacterium]|nr:alginate lyase family protein [Xanthobacteraceae bacterium]
MGIWRVSDSTRSLGDRAPAIRAVLPIVYLTLMASLVAGHAFAATRSEKLNYLFDRAAALAASDGKSATRAFRCGSTIRPMVDMSKLFGFYAATSTRSVIDKKAMARYTKRVWPTNALMKQLGRFRDMYLLNTAPRREVAACTVRNLRAWADAGALLGNLDDNDLMGHRQAALIIAWQTYSMANAYSLVAAEPGLAQDDLAAIRAWFTRLADVLVAEFTPPAAPREPQWRWLDATANHSNWAAVAVGSVGAITGDRGKLDFAMAELRKALAQVEESGAFPYEVRRGARSLQYQNFAMAAVAGLVALADANSVALTPAEEAALLRAARFTFEQSFDPSRLEAMTGQRQDIKPGVLGWTDVLHRHLARTDPQLADQIEARVRPYRPFVDDFLGGEITRLFNPQAALP